MDEENNPYREDGNYILAKSYCVFVDILGFTSEILENSKNKTELIHFQRIYECFTQATKSIMNKSHYAIKTKIFSDNILIGAPISKVHDDEDQLGSLAMYLKYLQLELALEGYFVRGGWTIGDLFIDENFIYGKALIDAYEIEQTTTFPRIELSEEIKPILEKHFEYYSSPEGTLQNTNIILNNDKLFINYLYGIIEYGDEGQIVDTIKLAKHKEIIESKLIIHSDVRIRSKYEWLAEYHNFFIQNFVEQEADEYKIEEIKLNAFRQIIKEGN